MKRNELSHDFYSLLRNYPSANNLIECLQSFGEVLLFGGAVREYNDSRFENIPRDFDLVIKRNNKSLNLDIMLDEFKSRKNRFGGYKVEVDSLEFDIWEIENTWAFREQKVHCKKENDYLKKLQDTVFLNIDSVVYNLTKNEIYDTKYKKAMKNKILDVVLEENPCKELNMIRAIVFKRKYNMEFSNKLKSIFRTFINENNNYLEELYNIQFSHYSECKINRDVLKYELDNIMT